MSLTGRMLLCRDCAANNADELRRIYEVTAPSGCVSDTLWQRGKTHGDFGNNATVALQIRGIMRGMKPYWSNLTAEQCLALEEIALKIARICSGGNFEAEHWHDIQGYAKLGEHVCDSRKAAGIK